MRLDGTNSTDPVDRIEWLPANSLKANDYNPNVVFIRELRLLEFSILKAGWVQPILTDMDLNIIDGFHRWRLALESKALQARDGGLIPVARLKLERPDAMLLTIRMNRAKGTHVAVRMSDIVQELVDQWHLTTSQVEQGIGAEPGEVKMLYECSIIASRNLKDYKYSKAWVPHEVRLDLSGKATR